MATISIVGTGYVGLVQGAAFADLGNQVCGIDIDEGKIARLKQGISPIYEPGLDELVARNVKAGRLRFTTSYEEAIPQSDFVFICVNTPSSFDGDADMRAVRAAAESIGRNLAGHTIVVNKSTMPIGSGDLVTSIIEQHKPADATFAVVSNPEFLREGAAVQDVFHPTRVVLGAEDRAAAEQVAELYRSVNAPVLITDRRSAEMIKYASNAFLATKISFINEIAQICERVGADVKVVAKGMGYDPRIGPLFLEAGIGFGGSCFEGHETVFALNSPNVATRSFASLFEQGGKPVRGDTVEVVVPEDQRVLAFDLATGQPTLAEVKAVTRRRYQGTMVTITTSMGRSLRVTADHPVILQGETGFEIVPASQVRPGNGMLALNSLPAVEPVTHLNLIDLLGGTELEKDVHVTALDGSFSQLYDQYGSFIPEGVLKHPWEIKRHNRMPLRLFRQLSADGKLSVPVERLQLYTAEGPATRINALLPVDADFLRLCGYYLAEGYITQDAGRNGSVRERVGFSFHGEEEEYIADVRRILTRWGLKFSERRTGKSVTTMTSSRLLSWLLRDVLKCGTRSDDKALPRLAFNVSPELRRELVRGAFSGDGAVTAVQGGKNLMLEYATVSKPLADGMALLLQTLGVMPALYSRGMSKSTQPAYILRVSRVQQLAALQDVFGSKHRARIEATLAGYQRHIRPHGYRQHDAYAVLTVRDVAHEEVDTTVYSMETSTGTLVASSGLICHNCFPKDVKALSYMAAEAGCHPQLLHAVMDINRDMRRRFVHRLSDLIGDLHGKRIGVWGLAFKQDTDDIRESPAIDIIRMLQQRGAVVSAYDPAAADNARRELPSVEYVDSPYAAAEGADAVLLITPWNEFKQVDLARVREVMRAPVLLDGRNIYDPEDVRRQGFVYVGIGR